MDSLENEKRKTPDWILILPSVSVCLWWEVMKTSFYLLRMFLLKIRAVGLSSHEDTLTQTGSWAVVGSQNKFPVSLSSEVSAAADGGPVQSCGHCWGLMMMMSSQHWLSTNKWPVLSTLVLFSFIFQSGVKRAHLCTHPRRPFWCPAAHASSTLATLKWVGRWSPWLSKGSSGKVYWPGFHQYAPR